MITSDYLFTKLKNILYTYVQLEYLRKPLRTGGIIKHDERILLFRKTYFLYE